MKTILIFMSLLNLSGYPLIAFSAAAAAPPTPPPTTVTKLTCATGIFKAEVSTENNQTSVNLISPAMSMTLPITKPPALEKGEKTTSTTYTYTAPNKSEISVKLVSDNTCTITFNLGGIHIFQNGTVTKTVTTKTPETPQS